MVMNAETRQDDCGRPKYRLEVNGNETGLVWIDGNHGIELCVGLCADGRASIPHQVVAPGIEQGRQMST